MGEVGGRRGEEGGGGSSALAGSTRAQTRSCRSMQSTNRVAQCPDGQDGGGGGGQGLGLTVPPSPLALADELSGQQIDVG